MVPYERVKGKKPSVMGVEFGEKLLYKIPMGNKMEKINSRWEYGIFVGVKRKSNQIMVATKEGIVFSRSVRRIVEELRWGEDSVGWIKWAPWHRYRDAPDADGDVPEGVPVDEKEEYLSQKGEMVFINTRDPIPRDVYLSEKRFPKAWLHPRVWGMQQFFQGRRKAASQ